MVENLAKMVVCIKTAQSELSRCLRQVRSLWSVEGYKERWDLMKKMGQVTNERVLQSQA